MNFKEYVSFFVNPGGKCSDSEVVNFYIHHPNLKVNELAKLSKRSVAEVYRILQANHVAPNRLGRNHHAVLGMSMQGHSIPEIAEFTGYTPRNVRYILAKHNRLSEGG